MIDRGDIRQAIDRCSNIWASPPGAGCGRRTQGWQPDCKIWSGRNGQRDWCMSRVTAIISALVICIIVCPSWAVNHYRDNAITYKAQRDKNARELEAGERGNYWHADASAWCCCARCKISGELADAKAENDALRDDAAAGRRRLHIKAVCQSVREATTPPAWIMQPPRLADTPLNGIISPSERGWSLCKTTGRNLWSINEQCRYCLHDGQIMQLLWAIHTASSGRPFGWQTEQSIYECLLGFCFNNIFCAATNLAASTVCPIPETKKWWVMALVLLLPV